MEDFTHRNKKYKLGLNFSVYWGPKHQFKRYPAYAGDEIWLPDLDLKTILRYTISCKIKDIPVMVYSFAHCEECMTPAGLIAELKKVYCQIDEMKMEDVLEQPVWIAGYDIPASHSYFSLPH